MEGNAKYRSTEAHPWDCLAREIFLEGGRLSKGYLQAITFLGTSRSVGTLSPCVVLLLIALFWSALPYLRCHLYTRQIGRLTLIVVGVI
jgi:hypothetical protein